MRKGRIILSLFLSLLTLVGGNEMMARGWEPVRVERSDTKVVVHDEEVEIKTAPGLIQITANHPVQIKIFTILGRLVSSETIPQGSMQFLVPAHGVYIVKVGEITCKVAV